MPSFVVIRMDDVPELGAFDTTAVVYRGDHADAAEAVAAAALAMDAPDGARLYAAQQSVYSRWRVNQSVSRTPVAD